MLFCCLDGVPERNVVVLFCNLLETQSLLCASTRNVPTHGASTVGLRYLIMIEFLYGNQLTNAIATLPPPPAHISITMTSNKTAKCINYLCCKKPIATFCKLPPFLL